MVVLFGVFFLFLIVGVPIFMALGLSSLAYTHFISGVPDFFVLHRMAGGVDSFPLLAVPFFILAGNLMNSAGITNRIFAFATAIPLCDCIAPPETVSDAPIPPGDIASSRKTSKALHPGPPGTWSSQTHGCGSKADVPTLANVSAVSPSAIRLRNPPVVPSGPAGT